jgi:DNA-binding response OmpR family regulator
VSEASILIVDDQPALLRHIKMTLEAAGYGVWVAEDGNEALEILASQQVDLILADIAMPRMNGYQLFNEVQQNPQWMAIPFIFLTARALDSDVRFGRTMGVDDYLTKPIQPEDLLAAVQGRLRRARQLAWHSTAQSPVDQYSLTAEPFYIDPLGHRVWMKGEVVTLSARELILLEYLARHRNQVIPQQELVRATHGLDANFDEAGVLLRPLVRSLRRKLGHADGDAGYIENVRGIGYRLTVPE